ncbi:acetyl-CoA C-acetyltransferase [Hydrogenibacillus schlegelii]|uniref:acetyl-CoA C-acetyltransferase n=1 Tax=Hydrogenibacillus schlegelii TaxID=1484 RepID=A0A132NAN6_HYDSH|nr:acetyl-CoA C-acetyltransferase [Hydrogenibacillus schlegelii]KWX06622.1 acetyl-CoA acetyltransferase [Hydrogenibacillus schlegelii]OAR04186.1 acetyl-CoA acetyltransferase [Hydrogenibacillus schlegelii]
MRDVVIVAGKRTPFGRFQGALKPLRAVELGAAAIRAALEEAGVDGADVDEVLMGMVLTAGAGQIPSRQAARLAGLPWSTPSVTVNKVCASGLKAVTLGAQSIKAGDADVVVAGGMESMSNVPYAVPRAREGLRMGDGVLLDLMVYDGLTCAFHGVHMAQHTNRVAREYRVSREAQDAFALESHRRAVRATEEGKFAEEIVPVAVPQPKGGTVRVERDEAPRPDTSLEKLRALAPVFDADGTITAGNAPGVNDGAAALVLMSGEAAAERGVRPLARLVGYAQVAEEAPYIATAPARAIERLLQKTGLRLSDIAVLEINEAFAAVPIISGRLLGLTDEDFADRLNPNGGAVALGHPIGASGARILLTLIRELRRRGGGYGIAAICSGSAQGDAVLVRVD